MKFIVILFISTCGLVSWSDAGDAGDAHVLSHQEALLGVAQLSGFFDRTISSEYTLDEITYLLSSYGITINVLKIWKNDTFTEQDMARTIGQIHILHRGEAQKQYASIRLPDHYKNWIEFCDIHGLDYQLIYRSLTKIFYDKKVVVN